MVADRISEAPQKTQFQLPLGRRISLMLSLPDAAFSPVEVKSVLAGKAMQVITVLEGLVADYPNSQLPNTFINAARLIAMICEPDQIDWLFTRLNAMLITRNLKAGEVTQPISDSAVNFLKVLKSALAERNNNLSEDEPKFLFNGPSYFLYTQLMHTNNVEDLMVVKWLQQMMGSEHAGMLRLVPNVVQGDKVAFLQRLIANPNVQHNGKGYRAIVRRGIDLVVDSLAEDEVESFLAGFTNNLLSLQGGKQIYDQFDGGALQSGYWQGAVAGSSLLTLEMLNKLQNKGFNIRKFVAFGEPLEHEKGAKIEFSPLMDLIRADIYALGRRIQATLRVAGTNPSTVALNEDIKLYEAIRGEYDKLAATFPDLTYYITEAVTLLPDDKYRQAKRFAGQISLEYTGMAQNSWFNAEVFEATQKRLQRPGHREQMRTPEDETDLLRIDLDTVGEDIFNDSNKIATRVVATLFFYQSGVIRNMDVLQAFLDRINNDVVREAAHEWLSHWEN